MCATILGNIWLLGIQSHLQRTKDIRLGNEKVDILVRQIAGKLARRIVNYLKEGEEVEQCEEFGFIKFGSRVDLFLPLNTKIDVNLKEKVKGGLTVIGTIPA